MEKTKKEDLNSNNLQEVKKDNQSKKNHQKITIILLLIIIGFLLIGLGIGGYFLFIDNEDSQEEDDGDQENDEESDDEEEEMANDENSEVEINEDLQEEPANSADTSEDGEFYGYLTQVYTESGNNMIKIDYIQMLSGKEAIVAAIEDDDCSVPAGMTKSEAISEVNAMTEDQMWASEYAFCIPNDYYIRNQNPKIRTFEVETGAPITTATDFENSPSDGITSLEFSELNAYNNKYGGIGYPLFIVTVEEGKVVEIKEQYLP